MHGRVCMHGAVHALGVRAWGLRAGGGWNTLRGCERNTPCVPALGGTHRGEGPMGAGGVHATYSGPRWAQLLPPPPPGSGVRPGCSTRGGATDLRPHSAPSRGRTPCVPPAPPPNLQPQYGPIIPAPIRGSERSLHTPSPPPRLPKQSGTPGGTHTWEWVQRRGHPQPGGGCRGGPNPQRRSVHADHHPR